MSFHHVPAGSCQCCADLLSARFGRRRFLGVAGAGLAAIALAPKSLFAAEGNYEAMMLSCIDPRFVEPVRNYAAKRELTGKYSQFVIAGASIGVVAQPFADWQKAFWDNLATSIQLHHIKKVIAVNHRDCGAAKIAFGEAKVADAATETETHRAALAQFRAQVAQRHPGFGVETGLMALDGSIEMIG